MKAKWRRSVLTALNLCTSSASLRQVQLHNGNWSLNLNIRLQSLLRFLTNHERYEHDPVALLGLLWSLLRLEMIRIRVLKHGLRRLELAWVRQSLYSQPWQEHTCLDHQQSIKHRIPELPLFLAPTGTVGVCKCTYVFLYICEAMP